MIRSHGRAPTPRIRHWTTILRARHSAGTILRARRCLLALAPSDATVAAVCAPVAAVGRVEKLGGRTNEGRTTT